MGLYNFEQRFVPFILSGAKTHTIRAVRAHPDKPGNMLHLYTGLRHPGARLLMRVPCVRVEPIWFTAASNHYDYRNPFLLIQINGHELSRDEVEALAKRDGFGNMAEMLEFWNGRLPFSGHIIHWQAPKKCSKRVSPNLSIVRLKT